MHLLKPVGDSHSEPGKVLVVACSFDLFGTSLRRNPEDAVDVVVFRTLMNTTALSQLPRGEGGEVEEGEVWGGGEAEEEGE